MAGVPGAEMMSKRRPIEREEQTKWLCCKDRPMPEDQDPKAWSHDFETVEHATFWDKLECKGCGYTTLAAPKP